MRLVTYIQVLSRTAYLPDRYTPKLNKHHKMNCENCSKKISSWEARYGDRESVFCKECFGTEEAKKIIEAKGKKPITIQPIKVESSGHFEQITQSDLQWFYSPNGKIQVGPISEEELIKAVVEKKDISKSSLVWNETFDDWEKFENISRFKKYFRVPPPLPKQNTVQSENESLDDKNDSVGNTYSSAGISYSDLEEKEGIENNLPTRWLSFYVNGWLPVGIILNLLGFSGDLNEEEILFQTVWILFLALTFLGLKNRKKWGWYLNWLIIFWLPIGGSLMFINHPYFIGYLIGGLLIFAIPNAIYFKKRKNLFFHIEQNQEVKNNIENRKSNSETTFFERSDKIKPPEDYKVKDLLTDSTSGLLLTLDDFENKVEHYSIDLPIYLCYELNIRGYTISADLVERLNQFSKNEFQLNFFDLTKKYKVQNS